MAKQRRKTWYEKEFTAQTLYEQHCTGIYGRLPWQSLLTKINEPELTSLGRQPLRQLYQGWTTKRTNLEGQIQLLGCKKADTVRELRDLAENDKHRQSRIRSLTAYQETLSQYEAELVAVQEVLNRLNSMIISAEEKPLIPQLRSKEWFTYFPYENHDKFKLAQATCVFCVPVGYFDKVDPADEGKIYRCTIEQVDFSEYNEVSHTTYVLRFAEPNSFAPDSTLKCIGVDHPLIMWEWEYEYLKAHDEFREVWLKSLNNISASSNEQGMIYAEACAVWEKFLQS